jgi:hypothetical protein
LYWQLLSLPEILLNFANQTNVPMIKQYKFLFTLAFFVAALATQAQGPITVGVSSHFTNFTTDNYFPPENWQIGIAKVSLGVPLTEKLTFSPSFAFGNAKNLAPATKMLFGILIS